MSRLSLSRVGVKFGPKVVLHDLTFDVDEGEFVAIVGASGVGKTTLLRIVAGLIKPTEGSVLIDGHTVDQWRSEAMVGFLFQRPLLLPWRTALANVTLPLEVARNASPYLEPADALAMVGLSDSVASFPWQLSGGMQQRVALARALVYRTQLLLMDEPFGALDAITRGRLHLELGAICERMGQTVLFVTHDLSEAVFMSDKVAVLAGNPARIVDIVEVPLERPRHPSIRDSHLFQRTYQWLYNQLSQS